MGLWRLVLVVLLVVEVDLYRAALAYIQPGGGGWLYRGGRGGLWCNVVGRRVGWLCGPVVLVGRLVGEWVLVMGGWVIR